MTVPEIIKHYWLKPSDRPLGIPAAQFYSGFWPEYARGEFDGPTWLTPGWAYRDAWSTGYREVYISQAERAILTYCESDLDLTVDADEATFQQRLASAEKFYQEVA